MLGAGVRRVAPVHGEMTQSFLDRLAARYGMGIKELLPAVADTGGRSNVMGRARPDSEVYLNQEARDRVAVLCRVAAPHLHKAHCQPGLRRSRVGGFPQARRRSSITRRRWSCRGGRRAQNARSGGLGV
ncbi:TniQ family protein [Streptomyces sp. NPDC008159]|uniref:TniQ family protein n=1 Tax=Streptomyces sp. NPDC008159 TaxID=3364817 RepID=UPI0036E154D9